MRLYQVSLDADFGDADGRCYWTARKADLPALRRRLVDECGDPAAGSGNVHVEIIDVHPTRDGLLDMLAKHANRGAGR